MGKSVNPSELGYNYLLTLVKNVNAPIGDREEAMWQLVKIGDPAALEELISLAEQPAPPELKAALIRAIGELTASLRKSGNGEE